MNTSVYEMIIHKGRYEREKAVVVCVKWVRCVRCDRVMCSQHNVTQFNTAYYTLLQMPHSLTHSMV